MIRFDVSSVCVVFVVLTSTAAFAQSAPQGAGDGQPEVAGDWVSSAPAAPTSAAAGLRLHIETDDPSVTLNRITGSLAVIGTGGSAYAVASKPVCLAPCDRVVDPGDADEFFFTGESAPASSSFRL